MAKRPNNTPNRKLGAMLVNIFLADLMYRLAQSMVGSRMSPTFEDLYRAQRLIGDFSYVFARVVPNEDGTVDWPNDKKGLLEFSYDLLEQDTNIALELLPLADPARLEEAARRVYADRDSQGRAAYVIPVPALGEEVDLDEKHRLLVPWLANKIVFLSSLAFGELRAANYIERFPSRQNIDPRAIRDFLLDTPIEAAPEFVSEDSEDLDHMESAKTSTQWDIARAIGSNKRVTLHPVELDRVVRLQEAARAYYTWLQLIGDDDDVLSAECARTRERAAEFVRNQRAAREFVGKPKLARREIAKAS